ncbi:CAAX prenyl protease 1 [Neolecta irregularis DAH-3]|uniref:Ste24 endopeptidase n=1 Tax=Neolecta irregularis (strain DAH-3) TaxID=1198029 RepID=A0A1U7LTB2_NEOID|nr:CAAX prenyl protease 1 [Neolecta irregularis DAH-3]|eukprot:OLL25782.1 CAAX prenyl protease 1 [Neolecta irregularis DAH-3]
MDSLSLLPDLDKSSKRSLHPPLPLPILSSPGADSFVKAYYQRLDNARPTLPALYRPDTRIAWNGRAFPDLAAFALYCTTEFPATTHHVESYDAQPVGAGMMVIANGTVKFAGELRARIFSQSFVVHPVEGLCPYEDYNGNDSNLEKLVDNPKIPWKSLVIAFSIGQFAFEKYLAVRQYQTLKTKHLPKILEGVVDQTTFEKAGDYQRAKAKFEFVTGLYCLVEAVLILQYNVIFKLWDLTGYWQLDYLPRIMHGEVFHCLMFLFFWPSNWTSIPINFVKAFHLEEAYGFNKQTYYIFFTDIVKHQLLTLGFGGLVLAGCLKIVKIFGKNFFFYMWAFFVAVQIIGIAIYPTFIQPLFNKLIKLKDGEIRKDVEVLASKLNFPLKELFVIDGSRRSNHSNAYFFGLPWSKQIVIYDTLLNDSTTSEVTAVLGKFFIATVHLFAVFTLFSVFITNASFYQSFGFFFENPIFIGFLLFNDILQPIDCLLKFGMNLLSRKHEFEADAFALNLGYAQDLSKALIGLHKNNLSTMIADPLYSAYHFSHPILTERLKALGWKDSKTVKPKKK